MGEYVEASRISPPLPANHTLLGGDFFRNHVRSSILAGMWQYRGYLLGQHGRKAEETDAQVFINRLESFVQKPQHTEVRAKSPARRIAPDEALNSLLLRTPMREGEWYEIAISFPMKTEAAGGTRPLSWEVQPAKVRTTRRGKIGIDPYKAGLLIFDGKDGIMMQGVHYEEVDNNSGLNREYTTLHPTVHRREFRDMYTVVQETFHYLRRQPRYPALPQ